MIWENFKMALASIRGAKMRSFLTMLGIIIGISAVATISSIGAGLQNQVTGQVDQLGANLVFVTPGQILSSKEGKQSFNPSASVGTSTLTIKDMDTITKLQGVKQLTFFSLISGIVAHDQTNDGSALLMATTPSFTGVLKNEKVDKGRFIADADNNANIVVLGSAARDALFGKDHDAVDQTVRIRNTDFKVVGVMGSTNNGQSFGGPSLDDAVFLPAGSAKALTGQELSISRFGIEIDNQADVDPTVSRIKDALKENHGGQEDFSVLTQKDLLSSVTSILSALTSAIAAIAAIALLVGGIGIMNIMLVSVTERTREIGIRKALGATRAIILTQFLIEAVTITVIGGVLGIAAAYAMARIAGRLIKITPVFTVSTFLTAAGVSVGIGIIFGLAPAIKAARKRPIEALRYE